MDGHALTASPQTLMEAGQANDVSVLAGTNTDEGSLFIQEVSKLAQLKVKCCTCEAAPCNETPSGSALATVEPSVCLVSLRFVAFFVFSLSLCCSASQHHSCPSQSSC